MNGRMGENLSHGSEAFLLVAGIIVVSSLCPVTLSANAWGGWGQSEGPQADSTDTNIHETDSLTVSGTSLDTMAVADTLQAESVDTAWFENSGLASLPFGFPVERDLTPGDLRLISREEIEKTGAQTLGELLLCIEDTEILYGGFLADQQYLSLDGSLPYEVVVMIDGVRAGEPSTGLMDLRDLPVESIYRLEILQGPMANVVAGEATGAVLNIVTSRHPGGVPVSRIMILDGDGGLTLVQGSFSREMPKGGFMHLTAASTSQQGLTEIVPSDNVQVSSRTGLSVRGMQLEAWLRRSSVDRENQDGSKLGSHERFTYGLTMKRHAGESTIFKGTISRTVHQFSGEFDFPVDNGSESGRTSIDLGFMKRVGEKNRVRGGFEWERLRLDGAGRGDRVLRGSVYTIGSFMPLELLLVQTGGRLDFFVNEGPKATGGFSLGYIGSRLVRPYLALSKGNYIFQMPGGMHAEASSWCFEGGADILPFERVRAMVSYRSRGFNEPGSVLTEEETSQDIDPLEGIGRMSSRSSFQTRVWLIASSKLSFGFGYTRSEFNDEWSAVFPSETILALSANLRKNLKGENLIFEGSAALKRIYEGEMDLLDVKAGLRIIDLVIFYSGRNMLDNRYEPLDGFKPQGRYAKWGFYWNFLD
ncbi:MAG: TonB-dependent receptor plug domain-containing protein [Candidatus Glassbacteria bacterium]